MDRIAVKITLEHEDLKPVYGSDCASGADLRANIQESFELKPGERGLIPTGLSMEIPAGFEAQVRPRSGLASRNGVTVLNSPGTIDSDYRGEIKIILINLGKEPYTINRGERIAQIVFSRVQKADFTIKTELEETERGSGGFGSTGK